MTTNTRDVVRYGAFVKDIWMSDSDDPSQESTWYQMVLSRDYDSLRTSLDAVIRENEALKSQDEVHWKTRRTLLVERVALQKALEKYGEHKLDCTVMRELNKRIPFSDAARAERSKNLQTCTCGYNDAVLVRSASQPRAPLVIEYPDGEV